MPGARKDGHWCYSGTENTVLTDASEDTAEGLGFDGGGNRRWGQRGVHAEQVSSETSDVGGGRGSSGEGVFSAIDPGGDNIGTYGTG